MEHGQRPEIDGLRAQPKGHQIAQRVQIGPPVMIDHALRVAGRARGVVQRQRLPLVVETASFEARVAFIQQIVIGELT